MGEQLLDIGLIVLFSFLGVLLSTRFKLPSVIGLLIFGALIGPHALGLVQDTELISFIFDMGAILLLFFIGIEFNMEKISHFGLRAVFVTFLKFGIIFFFTYILSLLFGMGMLEAIILGMILSFSSTAIFARLISGTPQQARDETQLMFAVLIIEDIFAIFLLTLLPQLGISEPISLGAMLLPLLISLAILFLFYIGLKQVVLWLSKWIEEKNTEAQLFLALALCTMLAFLASSFGLNPSIGAFFAGSAVSSMPFFKKVEGVLHQLFILFSAFFFFAIGMQADLSFVYASIGAVIIFTVMNIALKFISVAFSTYLAGFDTRGAFFSALIMLTVSEFALLISSEATNISDFDFVSFSAALVVLSSIISAVLFPQEAALNSRFNSLIGKYRVTNRLKPLSMYLGQVFKQFEEGGEFYETFNENARVLIMHAGTLVFANAALFVLRRALDPSFIPFSLGPLDAFELIAVLFSVYPAMRILSITSVLIGKFSDAFYLEGKEDMGTKEKMVQDTLFALSFFSISLVIPFAVSLLSLPTFLQALSFIPLIFSLIFVWDLALLCAEVVKPIGPGVLKGRMSSDEFYIKLHKHRMEMRARMLQREAETSKYLLAPISLIWNTDEKPKRKRREEPKSPPPILPPHLIPRKTAKSKPPATSETIYHLLNPARSAPKTQFNIPAKSRPKEKGKKKEKKVVPKFVKQKNPLEG